MTSEYSELLEKLPFQDISLLQQALTDSSYSYEKWEQRLKYTPDPRVPKSNDQLIILGLSLLRFLVIDYFYSKDKEPYISESRANKLVDVARLSKFAKEFELRRFSKISQDSTPEMLSNLFAAVIGAYYLDQGIEAVKKIVFYLFDNVIIDVDTEIKALSSKERQSVFKKLK